MATVAERVRKGAKLLDKEYPGWEKRIDLSILDLESTCDCILGQLYGGYGAGLEALLAGNQQKAANLAFGGYKSYRKSPWLTMTRTWAKAIFNRLLMR